MDCVDGAGVHACTRDCDVRAEGAGGAARPTSLGCTMAHGCWFEGLWRSRGCPQMPDNRLLQADVSRDSAR